MIDICGIRLYNEKIQNKEREDFIQLLLKDEVIKNNPDLFLKYMELYDKLKKESEKNNYKKDKTTRDDNNIFKYMFLW